MQETLVKRGFLKWLENLDVAPYPAIFFDTPKFIQQSYIQKWLREVHNLHTSVFVSKYRGKVVLEYSVLLRNFNISDGEKSIYERFKTHEEAFEYGLQQALKLIK